MTQHNLLGDVVAISDAQGNIVAEYVYDAWGNILSISGRMADINPIRYRGKYFDAVTGWYWLETRYYNPQWRRFINADVLFIAGCVLTAANMFAYCNNNPVMFIDPSGMSAEFFAGLSRTIAAFGIVVTVLANYSFADALRAGRVIYVASNVEHTGAEMTEFLRAFQGGIYSLIDHEGRAMSIFSARLFVSKDVSLAMGRFLAPHFNMTVQEIADEIYAHAILYHEFPTVSAIWRTFAPEHFEAEMFRARYTEMGPNVDPAAGIFRAIWRLTRGRS